MVAFQLPKLNRFQATQRKNLPYKIEPYFVYDILLGDDTFNKCQARRWLLYTRNIINSW